jgi:hypothetical protein
MSRLPRIDLGVPRRLVRRLELVQRAGAADGVADVLGVNDGVVRRPVALQSGSASVAEQDRIQRCGSGAAVRRWRTEPWRAIAGSEGVRRARDDDADADA